MNDSTNPDTRGGYKWLVLAMLLLVYTFNFLDRQVLGVLAKPIQAEFGFADWQFGLLGGVAFALLYSTLAVPLALVADKTSRTWVITFGLTLWSGFTALCGFAQGFWSLFACRVGVGVGEAGGVAPSYALIADHFPQHQRGKALAIYSLGIPLGLAAGVLLGGYIASWVDWRTAFIVLGVAGICIAPVFRLVVRDVPRAKLMPASGVPQAPLGAVFGILARKPSFWLLAFGASFSSMCGYALALWMPSVIGRSFGLDLIATSQFLGSLLLLGGVLGVFAGGYLADRMGSADRGAYAKIPAIAWLITAPLFALGLSSASSPTVAWLFLIIPNGLNILWLGPVTTAIQHLVPPHMRATAAASFLFINNLLGLGAGPFLMGALSSALKESQGDEALRYAAIAGVSFYLVAGVLALFAVKTLRKDWHEQ